MNRTSSPPTLLERMPPAGAPWLLAAGLALVTLAQFASLVPPLLGVAVLMLGSTLAVRNRVPPQLRLLAMSANLLAYLLLYGLFLGAVVHQAPWGLSPTPPPWLRLTDLGASAWLVVLSLQLGLRQIQSA